MSIKKPGLKQKKRQWNGRVPAPLLRFVALLALLAAIFCILPVFPALCIESAGGRLCLSLRDGEMFSIKYTHSVNHSPVVDNIERTGGTLTVRSSLYQTYGAGIPVLSDEVGDTYTETGDGFLLSGIDAEHEEIALITGTFADHRILYREQELVLKDYFGEQTLIRLSAGHASALQLLLYSCK